MLGDITTMRESFATEPTLDGRVDRVFEAMKTLGFDALVYDYTPVPYDLAGVLMIPSLLKVRNVADDLHEYWCDRGYFRIDPVQLVALRTTTPFFWDIDVDAGTPINQFMNESTAPAARYLEERDMTCGVTVPVHLPRGDYATVTGLRLGAKRDFGREAAAILANFSLLAHVFHESAYPVFDRDAQIPRTMRLTKRERECLRYAADGLSAKEISRAIDRSVPTVVMHLNAAARKLGAKNRTQAAVRAAHFRLLDDTPY